MKSGEGSLILFLRQVVIETWRKSPDPFLVTNGCEDLNNFNENIQRHEDFYENMEIFI
jgi:hypothetical protein